MDSLLELYNINFRQRLQESAIVSQRNYYQQNVLLEKKSKTRLTVFLSIIFLLTVLSSAIIIYNYRIRLRLRNLEIENLIEETTREKIESSKIIQTLFRERFKHLNMLYNEYFEKSQSGIYDKEIFKNIYRELQKFKSRKVLKEIEGAVNQNMGNIAEILRLECSDFLKESDLEFIILIYAGFSSKAVCMITGINYKNFFTKRRRLKDRILASQASHKNEFVEFLTINN